MGKHQIGILFVHGIGEQPEGETLLAFGQPVLDWVKDWLSRDVEDGVRGRIEVADAKLTPSKLNQPFPPHAKVRLYLEESNATPTSSWLVAESWWGGEVQRPAFGKLAGWMLTVGAWLVLSHMTKWAYACKTKTARVTIEILALVVGLPLALSLQISVLILSLLSFLPIPSLRKALSAVLLTLTGVLGDSYVLVESDLQRSAIVNKTRDTLSWLAERCESVIVIAHSQGASVAHHALRVPEPRNVSHLLTFGSGLGKLEELVRMKQASGRAEAIARVVPLLFLLAALIGYINVYEVSDQLSEFATILVGVCILIAVIFVHISASDHWVKFGQWAKNLSLNSSRPNLQWIDVYASHDLVTNGPLAPPGIVIGGLSLKKLVNLRSWLWDHTRYWINRCEFVPFVVRTIDEVASLRLFAPTDVQNLEQVAVTHRRNVRWLVAIRWATWISAALLFWFFWDWLLDQGHAMRLSLQTLDSHLSTVLGSLKTAVAYIFPFLSGERANEVGIRILGAVIPLSLITVWSYGYRFVWRW